MGYKTKNGSVANLESYLDKDFAAQLGDKFRLTGELQTPVQIEQTPSCTILRSELSCGDYRYSDGQRIWPLRAVGHISCADSCRAIRTDIPDKVKRIGAERGGEGSRAF